MARKLNSDQKARIKHFESKGKKGIHNSLKEWLTAKDAPSVNTMKCAMGASFAEMGDDSFSKVQMLMQLEKSRESDVKDARKFLRK